MTDRQMFAETDPRHHTMKLKRMLRDTAAHAREDVGKVDDPKAEALVEITAEVLNGLVTGLRSLRAAVQRAWR